MLGLHVLVTREEELLHFRQAQVMGHGQQLWHCGQQRRRAAGLKREWMGDAAEAFAQGRDGRGGQEWSIVRKAGGAANSLL